MGVRVGAYDWATTPLGPIASWPQSLRTAVGLVLASRFPACIVWGPGLVSIYNDAFQPILGTKPEALGQPFNQVWSEVWEEVGPIAERAFAGEATFIEDLPLTVERNGYPEEAAFTFCYSPVRDEAGRVAGFLDTVIETTSTVLTKRRQAFLLHLEERLRGLTDRRETTLAAVEALAHHLGVARAGYGEVDAAGGTVVVERDWTDGTVASLAGEAHIIDALGPTVAADLHAGTTLVVEDCLADPRVAGDVHTAAWAGIGTRALVVMPLMEAGRLRAILYLHEPVPRRWSAAEIALAKDAAQRTWAAVERAGAEEVNARLAAIVASTTDAVIAFAAQDGRILAWNRGAEELFGYTEAEALGGPVSMLVPPDLPDGDPTGVFRRAMGGERVHEHETARMTKSGERIPVAITASRMLAPNGRTVGVATIFRDLRQRKVAEARQALLSREVNHRAKNLLAVVQAALRLTRAPDLPSYVRAITGRVAALARAQMLLADERWVGADLRTLLTAEMDAFLSDDGTGEPRASLTGPTVVLPAGAAQPVAMVVHELATNATKHGALSAPGGRIAVTWSLDDSPFGALRLRWTERGGPPVMGSPTRRGFGTRVLDSVVRGQLGGEISLIWNTSGMVCNIELPLARLARVSAGDLAAD